MLTVHNFCMVAILDFIFFWFCFFSFYVFFSNFFFVFFFMTWKGIVYFFTVSEKWCSHSIEPGRKPQKNIFHDFYQPFKRSRNYVLNLRSIFFGRWRVDQVTLAWALLLNIYFSFFYYYYTGIFWSRSRVNVSP